MEKARWLPLPIHGSTTNTPTAANYRRNTTISQPDANSSAGWSNSTKGPIEGEYAVKTYLMPDSVRYRNLSARELRDSYLLDSLDAPGEVRLAYMETDRAVVGMASPVSSSLALPCDPELRAKYFLERRELGALNIGGAGTIVV